MYQQIFIENIRKVLDDRRITPYELAALSGVPTTTIYRVLGGKHGPTMAVTEKLAAGLKLPLTYLLDPSNADPSPARAALLAYLSKLEPGKLHICDSVDITQAKKIKRI
jgi:transcriptional regulator with XRE-family HTH domain